MEKFKVGDRVIGTTLLTHLNKKEHSDILRDAIAHNGDEVVGIRTISPEEIAINAALGCNYGPETLVYDTSDPDGNIQSWTGERLVTVSEAGGIFRKIWLHQLL